MKIAQFALQVGIILAILWIAIAMNAIYWVFVQPLVLKHECSILHVTTGSCAENIKNQSDIIIDGNAP